MKTYYTPVPVVKDKIIELFSRKNVDYILSVQFTFLFNTEFKKSNELISKRTDIVYMFQWSDNKVKKTDLLALENS